MQSWKGWKQGFDAWEQATATWLEQVMQSPLLLGPAGSVMSAAMRAKAEADKQAAAWWGQAGVAIKRDQERALHGINELGSKLLDLEELIAAQREEVAALRRAVDRLQPAAVVPTAAPAVAPARPAQKRARKKKSEG